MSLSARGKHTSAVEVTNISSHGLWLLVHDKDVYLSYEDFPWFQEQPVRSIVNVEEHSPGHFYWPDLDVDLSQEIIKHPTRFPLKAKSLSKVGRPTK